MAQLALINPTKRKKRRAPVKKKSAPKRRMSVARKAPTRKVRRRRNPAPARGIQGMIKNSVMPAITAAGGATALDVVWGVLPLPAQVKSGPIRHVAKAAGALAVGMVASNVVKRETANLLTLGMLTTVTHSAMREMVTKFAPNLALGMVTDEMNAAYGDEMGYISPTPVADGMGEYYDDDGELNAVPAEELIYQ